MLPSHYTAVAVSGLCRAGVRHDAVTRRLVHVPCGWKPAILEVVVPRYRCRSCRRVWRHTRAGDKMRHCHHRSDCDKNQNRFIEVVGGGRGQTETGIQNLTPRSPNRGVPKEGGDCRDGRLGRLQNRRGRSDRGRGHRDGPLPRRWPREGTNPTVAANASNKRPWGVEAARVTRSTVSDASPESGLSS